MRPTACTRTINPPQEVYTDYISQEKIKLYIGLNITDELRQEGLEMLRADAADTLTAPLYAPDVPGGRFFPIVRFGTGYLAQTISSREAPGYIMPMRSQQDAIRRNQLLAKRYWSMIRNEDKTDAEVREFLNLPPGPLSFIQEVGAELKDVGSE